MNGPSPPIPRAVMQVGCVSYNVPRVCYEHTVLDRKQRHWLSRSATPRSSPTSYRADISQGFRRVFVGTCRQHQVTGPNRKDEQHHVGASVTSCSVQALILVGKRMYISAHRRGNGRFGGFTFPSCIV